MQVQWLRLAPASGDDGCLIYQQSSKRPNIINQDSVGLACLVHKLEI